MHITFNINAYLFNNAVTYDMLISKLFVNYESLGEFSHKDFEFSLHHLPFLLIRRALLQVKINTPGHRLLLHHNIHTKGVALKPSSFFARLVSITPDSTEGKK